MAVAAVAAIILVVVQRPQPVDEKRADAVAPTPVASRPPAEQVSYVDNQRCVECHATEAKKWETSHHFGAMARASDQTVLGDFHNSQFRHAGVTTHFFKRDGKFFVRTDGPDGKRADFEVKYTFGVAPLQQYLIELPGGRLQAFTIAWDTQRQRWFHLYPNEKTPPGDVLHWTGRYQNWNMMCAACHTTNLQKNYEAASDSYRTTWSEINVSCQSCHGPGAKHVAWAESHSGASYGNDGLVVDLKSGSAGQQVDLCAACHSRRSELAADPVPGKPLFDQYLPVLLREGLYYADGQQLGEVYEYGSFRQSRMYQAGVRCSDCHDPHALTLKRHGNELCLQCHRPGGDQRFPQAAGLYDDPSHHFHKPGSAGAVCVNCHMPAKNYMIVHSRPDHSFRIPRPDLTVKIGVPNACTQCHADKSAQWAAQAVKKWYGKRLHDGPHYGEVLAAGRAGKRGGDIGLEKLAGDTSVPAIVRATALELLRNYGTAGVSASAAATRDADPAVRTAAVAGLERVSPPQRVSLAAPLLDDPVRAVRIEAARVLSSAPRNLLNAAQGRSFDTALAEFMNAEDASIDMPGSNLNVAVVEENMGNTAAAEAHYLKALTLDPDFSPARLNLAQLYNRLGRNADAERVLQDGLKRVPDQGELLYSLGLLFAEEKRLPEAAAALGKAATLLPDRARVQYNYGLALRQVGKRKEAQAALVRAHALDGEDLSIVYALALFYAQDGEWQHALQWAERLEQLEPLDPQVRAFVAGIRARASGKQ